MASGGSPYAGTESGHPVNGTLTSTGQSNTPTPVTNPRQSGTRALMEREHALDGASSTFASSNSLPGGALSAESKGIFGLPGLALSTSAPVPIVVTAGRNIELKRGTQIVLRLEGPLPQR